MGPRTFEAIRAAFQARCQGVVALAGPVPVDAIVPAHNGANARINLNKTGKETSVGRFSLKTRVLNEHCSAEDETNV